MSVITMSTLKCPPKIGDLSLRTHDIIFPRRQFLDRPKLSLQVKDIPGAVPKQKNMHLGKRSSNPLEPKYQLASYTPADRMQYRYTKCSMKTKDVPGATFKPPFHMTAAPRDHIGYSDVKRSTQGWRQRTAKRTTNLNSLDVYDINKDLTGMHRFNTRRRTNPLSPRYVLSKQSDLLAGYKRSDRQTVVIGAVHQSHPSTSYRFANKEKDFTLRTGDVAGATVVPDRYYRSRAIRNPCRNDDIPGTAAGSFKPFRSLRRTNPINPRYTYLDTPEPSPRPQFTQSMPIQATRAPVEDVTPLELTQTNLEQAVPAHAAVPRSKSQSSVRSYRSGASHRSRRSSGSRRSLSRAGANYIQPSMAHRRANEQLADDIASVRSLC